MNEFGIEIDFRSIRNNLIIGGNHTDFVFSIFKDQAATSVGVAVNKKGFRSFVKTEEVIFRAVLDSRDGEIGESGFFGNILARFKWGPGSKFNPLLS